MVYRMICVVPATTYLPVFLQGAKLVPFCSPVQVGADCIVFRLSFVLVMSATVRLHIGMWYVIGCFTTDEQ